MEDREQADEERAGIAFWLLLALPVLAFSAYYSHAAPCGRWRNHVHDAPMWMENDPSGSYIASAHELFTADPGPLFPGHPGTTLQLLLFGLQHAYDAVANDGSLGFTEFTARHIATVTVLSKLLATVLHVVSFYLVYRFSRRLLGGERGAVLGTLAYATCFPVLYYLSRVSVEPLIVIFFAGTFLAIWSSRGSLASAALVGVLAVSGLVTKLHFFGPLPLFALVYLLACLPRERRPKAALAYVVAAAVALALYSTAIDWGDLFAKWERVGQIKESATRSNTVVPGFTPGGIFPLAELVFLPGALVGLLLFFRRRPEHRGRLAWVAAYTAFSFAVWGYRVMARGWDFRSFHYLFLVMVFLAPFFGHAVEGLLARVTRSRAVRRAAGVVLVLAVHAIAIWSAFDTRAYDVEQCRMIRDVHELTPTLGPDQRVVLLDREGRSLFRRMLQGLDPGGCTLNGLSVRYAPEGAHSRLMEAYADLFPRVRPADVPAEAPRGTLQSFGAYAVIEAGP